MKVKDLIERLKLMPQEAEVIVEDLWDGEDGGYWIVSNTRQVQHYEKELQDFEAIVLE